MAKNSITYGEQDKDWGV